MSLRRIVVVSKDPEVQQLAQEYGQEIFGADNLTDALDVVQTVNPDLVLFDHRFGPRHIHEFRDRADKNSIDVPIVVVDGDDNNTDLSTEFIQNGAYDYLKSRQDYAQLEQIIKRIEINPPKSQGRVKSKTSHSEQSTNRFFAEELAGSVSMVGCSKAILDTLKMIKLVAASRCNPILIVGETGTGKELAAKAIHILRHPPSAGSGQAHEQFVAVNCAALTANLLESELFGHMKGSFTGADREKTGLMELAQSGTLLLDEISEMPIDLQAKLLRVLQEKSFRKVGGIKNIPCSATIIASSNRNLKNEVKANRFRSDLYYRLNISPITLAPLRSQKRREDIRLLAKYFLKTSTICPQKCGKITSLTELAFEALERHDWPGNVRELCNVIERAILLETTDKIGLNTIYIDPTQWSEASDSLTPGLIKDFSLAKAERELIARALQKTGWQKTRAAALLGITRATLYAKVKQYNIEKDSYNANGSAKQEQNEVSASSLSQPVATF
ncbi:MAG TPA: sigma-54 dependent transcriptional regulator [Sedimentisphaerales bacterium]|nr:sigma-54 dependent transcriptional regulator [Sedimentisphaerales bacterium]